jgi:hypothetical protein
MIVSSSTYKLNSDASGTKTSADKLLKEIPQDCAHCVAFRDPEA